MISKQNRNIFSVFPKREERRKKGREKNKDRMRRKIWHRKAHIPEWQTSAGPDVWFSPRHCIVSLPPSMTICSGSCTAVRVGQRLPLLKAERRPAKPHGDRRSEPGDRRRGLAWPVKTGKSQLLANSRVFQSRRSPDSSCLFNVKPSAALTNTPKTKNQRAPEARGFTVVT